MTLPPPLLGPKPSLLLQLGVPFQAVEGPLPTQLCVCPTSTSSH